MTSFSSMTTSRRQSHRPQSALAASQGTDRVPDQVAPLPSSLKNVFPGFLSAASTLSTNDSAASTSLFSPSLSAYQSSPQASSSSAVATTAAVRYQQRCPPSEAIRDYSLERFINPASCDFSCVVDSPVGCSVQSSVPSSTSAVPSSRPYRGHHPNTSVSSSSFVTTSHHWPNKSISSSSEGSSTTNTTNPSPTTSISTAPFDSPTTNRSPCSVSDGLFFLQETGPSRSERSWPNIGEETDDLVKPLPSLMLPLSPSDDYARQMNDSTTETHGQRISRGDTASHLPQPSGQSHRMPARTANDQKQRRQHYEQGQCLGRRNRQISVSSACSGISESSSPAYTPATSPNRKSRRNIKSLTINMPGVSTNTSAAPQFEKNKEQDLCDTPVTSNIAASRPSSLPLRRLSAPASPSVSQMPSRPCNECNEETNQNFGVGARRSRRRPTNLTIQTPKWDSSFVAVSATGSTSKNVPPTPCVQKDMSSEAECRPRRYLHHYKSSPSVLPSPSLREPLTSTAVAEKPEDEMMAEERDEQGFKATTGESQSRADVQSESEGATELKTVFFEKHKDGHDDMYRSPPPTRESHQETPQGYPNGPICIYDEGLYLYLEPEVQDLSSFDVVVNVAEEVRNPYKAAIAEGKPLASTINSKQEYVHVPWSHSSEILQDLYPLCQFIDSRISQSKRVLIHCQLGVSRSASLVIAYGLYKNPDKDFNEMYRIVKERSEWVGPNLGLIYQLMDFRGQVIRGNYEPPRDIPQSWFESPGRLSEGEGRRDRAAAGRLAPSSSQALPSAVANHGHSRFMEVPESQRPTEPISPPFIKTSFFANDDESSDKQSDPPVGSTPSSSPPLSFADLTLKLRRNPHTSKPLPLRQMFEKPTDSDSGSKEPSATPLAPPDYSQCSQKLSVPPLRPILAPNRQLDIPAIGEVLEQEKPPPSPRLAPPVIFHDTSKSSLTSTTSNISSRPNPNPRASPSPSPAEVARAATILESPRTVEFSKFQGPAANVAQARRASLQLASLSASADSIFCHSPYLSSFPSSTPSSSSSPSSSTGVAGGVGSKSLPSLSEGSSLPFEDPRSPPPRSANNICPSRREGASFPSQGEMKSIGRQQTTTQLQTTSSSSSSSSPRVEPMALMENIAEFLL